MSMKVVLFWNSSWVLANRTQMSYSLP